MRHSGGFDGGLRFRRAALGIIRDHLARIGWVSIFEPLAARCWNPFSADEILVASHKAETIRDARLSRNLFDDLRGKWRVVRFEQ